MPDMRIRRAAPADLPVLTRLWQAAFGDPPELIERFYRRFPPAKAAWVVEAGGCVVTAAHLLEGRLHTADGGVLPCAYVYAVSTDPAHQGNGYASALMRRFAMDADASGCVLYTLPAEASLYKWYQAVMGTTQTARGERIRIARQQTAGTLPNVTRISAPEYAVLRAQQLQGQTYAEPSAALMDFQADLCAMCGVFLGCAKNRVPVVIDGFISVVAALCAARLCGAARDYFFASHESYEIGYQLAEKELGLEPWLVLGMRLGEGSGCTVAFRIMDAACAVINEMATFAEGAIDDGYLDEIRANDSFTVDREAP